MDVVAHWNTLTFVDYMYMNDSYDDHVDELAIRRTSDDVVIAGGKNRW